MKTLKYKVIKNQDQYDEYCDSLERIILKHSAKYIDEIDLLTLLISEYNDRIMDEYQFNFNPVELLLDMMKENQLSQIQLSRRLEISPQLLNDVIKYRREITKNLALKLSKEFKLKYSAFLKPYKLKKAG